MAEAAGATIVTGEPVVGWRATGDGVVVETATTRYRAGKLVITAGAWAAGLLAELAIPLTVRRKHLHWYRLRRSPLRRRSRLPVLLLRDAGRLLFYGFPEVGGTGVKVAEHTARRRRSPIR